MSGAIKDLDLADVVRGMDRSDLFIRNIPEPGTPMCGARIHPEPAQEIADRLLDEIHGMTTCILPPGHAKAFRDTDGRMKTLHVGVLVTLLDALGPSMQRYQWINPRALGALQ